MATKKKAKPKPVVKPPVQKCSVCGCPTHTLFAGKCYTCHVYGDDK